MKQKINKEAYDRLLIERDELDIKHNKLEAFIMSDKIKTLQEESQKLLYAQYGVMNSYLIILNTRIANLEVE